MRRVRVIAAWISGASACLEPTQITLEIKSNIVCADVRDITITVGTLDTLEWSEPATSTNECGGTIVLVPSASKDPAAVRVVAGIGQKSATDCTNTGYKGGCIVARRAVRYVPHTRLVLPITLDTACIDVPCGATQTCVKGACVPAMIEQCDRANCEPDGGPIMDASVPIVQRSFGGPEDDIPTALTSDVNGNLYVVGSFFTKASFGGPMATGSALGNAFLASYEPATLGFRWQAIPVGTSQSMGSAVSTAMAVLWAGWTSGPIDFGSGAMGSPSATVPFRSLHDFQGKPPKSTLFGAGPNDRASAAALDLLGNEYIGGTCNSPTLINTTPCGQDDGFIVSFSANGMTRWAQLLPHAPVLALATDSMHLFAGGRAEGTSTDFGSGTRPVKGGGDAFVASYALNGINEWAVTFGDGAMQSTTDLAIGGTEVYALGQFAGTLTANATTLTAQAQDVFLIRLDPLLMGKPVYARQFGGAQSEVPGGIAASKNGNVYACGGFQGTADFGKGPVTAVGRDAFVLALGPSGSTIDARTYAGGPDVVCTGIAYQAPQTLFLTGWFAGSVTFGGPPLTSAGKTDGFLVRVE